MIYVFATHRTEIACQRGSTLIVSLIMLALLTLIALSAMKGTTSSIQVVGNAQFREEAKAAAQKAMETVLSNGDFRSSTPAAQNIDVNGDGTADYSVTFADPICQRGTPVAAGDPGVPNACAAQGGLAICYWTAWDIRANVSDLQTGASVVLHQGVRTIAGVNDAMNQGCL